MEIVVGDPGAILVEGYDVEDVLAEAHVHEPAKEKVEPDLLANFRSDWIAWMASLCKVVSSLA